MMVQGPDVLLFCPLFLVTTAHQLFHIFLIGTGFILDALPDATYPFYPCLGP